MKAIPAIDIMEGRVVRLIQGDAAKKTLYSNSPMEIAERWASYGVDLIHIVDLDGAFKGSLKNFDLIKDIAKRIKPKIELGGGIRDIKTVNLVLESGIEKVCIGTKALDDRFMEEIDARFKDRIVVSIDAKDGIVYSRGWVRKTEVSAIDLAKKVTSLGIKTINYTDISKDGMMEGPNIKTLRELLKATNIDVVASGGVSTIGDIRNLKELEKYGLTGVIIGKALYEGKIELGEAVKLCAG